jgi:hypothetical protein
MSSTATVLIPGVFAATGAATMLYTSPPGGKGTWIDAATATNDNAAAQTLTLYRVPAGETATADNLVAKAKSIGIGATDLLPELRGKFLKPGDAIWAVAGAASAIALDVSGRELT